MRASPRVVIGALNQQDIVSTNELRMDSPYIVELLHSGKVSFVVANIGEPLRWIPVDECYDFWKSEVKNHLADPQREHFLEDFPDEYFYRASEWESPIGVPIVLVTMLH